MSKDRVASLKKQTMSRLELCGALLLSNLLQVTANNLQIPTSSMYAWRDSAVILGWLNKPIMSLTVYMAHRVEAITE